MRNVRRFERRQEGATQTVLDYFLLPENETPILRVEGLCIIYQRSCYRHFLRLVTIVDWYDEAGNYLLNNYNITHLFFGHAHISPAIIRILA